MRQFCRKNHVHKIPRFRGGGYFGFFFLGGGEGSADFIFMGVRIFLKNIESAGEIFSATREGLNMFRRRLGLFFGSLFFVPHFRDIFVLNCRRRTNVQQLTCNLDLSCCFLLSFFSFVFIELKPFVLKGRVLGENFWKKCEKFWNDFAL